MNTEELITRLTMENYECEKPYYTLGETGLIETRLFINKNTSDAVIIVLEKNKEPVIKKMHISSMETSPYPKEKKKTFKGFRKR